MANILGTPPQSAVKLQAQWTEADDQGLQDYLKTCERLKEPAQEMIVLVNTATQTIHRAHNGKIVSFPISTGRNGTGQEVVSGKTPLGLHIISKKIGDKAHPLLIFESGCYTGVLAELNGKMKSIVGRILCLQGLEPGYNQGYNEDGTVVDSERREISIHGTNQVSKIGQPSSDGCIQMIPKDAVQLFQRVSAGTHVYIS